MLAKSHVLDLIRNSTNSPTQIEPNPPVTVKPKETVDDINDFFHHSNKKQKFLNDHKHGWAIIRQEHKIERKQNNKGALANAPAEHHVKTINHIESVHKSFDELPFDKMTKDHIVHPISADMFSNPSFKGIEKHLN